MNARKYIIESAALTNTNLHGTHYPAFVTLTYRDGEQWNSRDISKFIERVKRYIQRKLDNNKYRLTYIWTAENHKDRDYIHYHLIIWIPEGIIIPKPDEIVKTRNKSNRVKYWPHGTSNIQKARNPAGYIAKYLSKKSEKLKVQCRRYCVNVRHIANVKYFKLPTWLKYFVSDSDKVVYKSGFGWVNYTKQQLYKSPYKFSKKTGLSVKAFGLVTDLIHEFTEYDKWMIYNGDDPFRKSEWKTIYENIGYSIVRFTERNRVKYREWGMA